MMNLSDTNPIKEIAPNLPVDREEGTVKTLEWINRIDNISSSRLGIGEGVIPT